ncbi:hypothetical protein ACFU5O_22485 [Streptomyces sp. NPDC057445]|uniref:hypothetical protein n=1 Tax=Streptomyces sp. NPDC057445 TaxID=3346136 RepID=UPI003683D7A1
MTTLRTGKTMPDEAPGALKRRVGLLRIQGVLAVGGILLVSLLNNAADQAQEDTRKVQAVNCLTCHWF